LASDTAGDQYRLTHQQEFIDVEGVASAESETNSKNIATNNPIISQLPIDATPNYRVDYGVSKKYPNDPSKIALYISADSDFYRHVALSAIYLAGYDPSDYEIIFQPMDLSNL
jgi:hypothetical protein